MGGIAILFGKGLYSRMSYLRLHVRREVGGYPVPGVIVKVAVLAHDPVNAVLRQRDRKTHGVWVALRQGHQPLLGRVHVVDELVASVLVLLGNSLRRQVLLDLLGDVGAPLLAVVGLHLPDEVLQRWVIVPRRIARETITVRCRCHLTLLGRGLPRCSARP